VLWEALAQPPVLTRCYASGLFSRLSRRLLGAASSTYTESTPPARAFAKQREIHRNFHRPRENVAPASPTTQVFVPCSRNKNYHPKKIMQSLRRADTPALIISLLRYNIYPSKPSWLVLLFTIPDPYVIVQSSLF
jgi:hypothetical protein